MTRRLKITKTYSENSKYIQQYEALKEYYGSSFNEIFFQAAWSVLSCLGDSLIGTPARTLQRNKGACQHFIEAIYLEALTQANGDFDPVLLGRPTSFNGGTSDLALDDGYSDFGGLDLEDNNDPAVAVGVPIAGDPFG